MTLWCDFFIFVFNGSGLPMIVVQKVSDKKKVMLMTLNE